MAKKKQKMQKAEKVGTSSSVGIYLIGIVAVVAVVAVVILIQQAKGVQLNLPSIGDAASDSVTGLASAGNREMCIMKAREQGVIVEKRVWNPRAARYEMRSNLIGDSTVTAFLSKCRKDMLNAKKNRNTDTTGSFGIAGSRSTMG